MALEKYRVPDKQNVAPAPRLSVQRKLGQHAKAANDDRLAGLAAQVSEANLKKWDTALAAFPTRHTASPQLGVVGEWIAGQFRSMGYTTVSFFHYSRDGLSLRNVVCRKQGADSSAPTRIVCAHFDSRMQDLNDSGSRAPGANDNGTGIAILLELARIVRSTPTPDAIEFLATSGEEQGLWGSSAYAEHVKQTAMPIRFVLNIDEVGFPASSREVIVERDEGNAVPDNDQASQELAGDVAQVATDQLGIPTALARIYDSDYMPFEARGYVVIGIYESGKYPQYHRSDDTPDHVDFPYVANAARVALTALLHA